MPATTLRLDDSATHAANVLQWVSTPAVQDTAAGGSVVITTVRTAVGVPPGDPTSLTLDVTDDAGTVVRSFALNTTSASQTSTFFFTDTGATGGVARADTVEIKLRATRTTVVTYDVETDGTPNTVPAGFDSHLTRGWIRGTTTLVEAVSNVALGGAKTSPAEYDESLFVRTTAGAVSYVARTLTVASSSGSLSSATNSTTAAQRDVTFANVVDDRFAAASTVVTWTVTPANATISGQPFTSFTSTTDDTITVDPRVTATLHFQVDDDVFAIAAHDTSLAMLSTQSGFLWPKLTAARGTGVNGVTINQTLDPTSPGTTITGTATATTTQDGTVGVGGKLDWTASKPGGSWVWSCDITAPADIDNNAHLTAADILTMLAPDPRLEPLVFLGFTTTGNDDRHVRAGDSLRVAFTIKNRDTRTRVAPDVNTVFVSLLRYVPGTGWQYLTTGGTWTAWSVSVVADQFALTDDGDGVGFTRDYTSTSGWGTSDIVAVNVTCKIGGTPYGWYSQREIVGNSNSHSGNTPIFDPLTGSLHLA